MNCLKIYISFIFVFIVSCNNNQKQYLNISNDINYVGMTQCAACHQKQYETFINTGMGKSIRPALKNYSSSLFFNPIYDEGLNFYYNPYWVDDSLFIDEYQLSNNDTIHYLNYHIDYIVGSGHHTNSHLLENNGYLYQAPFTYYTQDSILDFPPGFENDDNSRFSRKMGLECVACHNAYPDFILGSENKYNDIPTGIDCERCHGPGQLHIEKIKNNHITDTAKHIDYTIINPSHLSVDLQNDLCARCHLQGNTVLTNNASFFDFRPGMYLNEVMDVYLPRYSNSENDFIMASHVDRMKLSTCYIESEESLSCVTCHNPHVSVHKMPDNFFNSQCFDCHNVNDCKEDENEQQKLNNDCVMCHMQKSKTTDIPHVTITDHKIGIRDTVQQKHQLKKEFLGLECVNNTNPSDLSLAQAYLQQYERFEQNTFYLDSAETYLNSIDFYTNDGIYMHIYYLFLKEEYDLIIKKVESIQADSLLNYYLIEKDYANKDAWTCYRIGEAFMKREIYYEAFTFYQKSVKLAPYNLEFRNKYGVSLFHQNKIEFAIDEFKFIINEDNNFVSAYTNLGYLYFSLGERSKALLYYDYALLLDPNHEKTLINKAQLLILDNKVKDAFICVDKLLKLNPNHNEAIILLNKLNEI